VLDITAMAMIQGLMGARTLGASPFIIFRWFRAALL
jgi:hypothetical protein